jgi:hypothetical protein
MEPQQLHEHQERQLKPLYLTGLPLNNKLA